jgi:ribonuclease Z
LLTDHERREIIMIEAALLGTGGGMPMPGRNLSALLIRYKGRKILLDCGEGTQVSMRMLGWGFKSLDVICITHGHGDHMVGLPGLLTTLGNSGRTNPITIIGPAGITEIVHGLRVIAPFLPYGINIIEAPKEPVGFSKIYGGLEPSDCTPDITISTLDLDHTWPCIGYGICVHRRPEFDPVKAEGNRVPKELWNRLQGGESPVEYLGRSYSAAMVQGAERKGIKLSFITDTRPTGEIPGFIDGSDLFVCEGVYGDDSDIGKALASKHMTFREAARLARDGCVKELLLTHFSPSMEDPAEYLANAQEVFENTTIGTDRMVRELNFG